MEQFSREGWEPLIGTVWDPEIVWNMSPTGIPGLGTYRGSDELRSFFEDWFSTFPFQEWEQELDEVIDCGERVVALTRQRGRGSGSGAVAREAAYAQVIKLREGRVVEVDMYIRDKALEAAGLSE